jgi:hypothetical protein
VASFQRNLELKERLKVESLKFKVEERKREEGKDNAGTQRTQRIRTGGKKD